MHPDQPDLTCEEAEGLFSAFWEDDLSESDKERLQAHLEKCPQCTEGFSRFKESLEALKAYAAPQAPPDFLDGIIPPRMTRPSPWPLRLAWATTAAAMIVAVLVWLNRPEPRTLHIPVDRYVLQEKIVEKEVPVPIPVEVEVPVHMPVSVALAQGGLELLRNGEVQTLAPGERVLFQEGDTIRALAEKVDPPAPCPTIHLAFDFNPLANAFVDASEKMAQTVAQVAEAVQKIKSTPKPAIQSPVPDFERPAPKPPVALVWEPDGSILLETSGPDHEVVPQLIAMLDHEDAQVSAVAWGRLKSIQERLSRDHGINAPRTISAPAPEKDESGWDALSSLFGSEDEEPLEQEISASEPWYRWWRVNENIVSYLALSGMR